MKHLVLGGSGFIGFHVARRLIQGGEQVVLASRSIETTQAHGGALEHRRFDLTEGRLDALVAGCDVVHHYAWSSLPESAALDPASDVAINLAGTLRILEAMRRHGDQRIVFASSGGTVYGRGFGRPSREDDPTVPMSAYGVTKLAAENYIKLFASSGGPEGRVARISNPFGGLQRAKSGFGAVAYFTRNIVNGDPVQIFGSGSTIRDFLHIDDLVDALRVFSTKSEPQPFIVCNIASGVPVTLLQLVDAIQLLAGRPASLQFLPRRDFDLEYSCLDIQRISNQFAWQPKLTLKAGLEKTLAVGADARRLAAIAR